MSDETTHDAVAESVPNQQFYDLVTYLTEPLMNDDGRADAVRQLAIRGSMYPDQTALVLSGLLRTVAGAIAADDSWRATKVTSLRNFTDRFPGPSGPRDSAGLGLYEQLVPAFAHQDPEPEVSDLIAAALASESGGALVSAQEFTWSIPRAERYLTWIYLPTMRWLLMRLRQQSDADQRDLLLGAVVDS